MSSALRYIINAHYNKETHVSDVSGFGFQNTDVVPFIINGNSSFLNFKDIIKSKLGSGPVSQIIY